MNKLIFTFCFIVCLGLSSAFPQTSGNIHLLSKTRFDRYWGVGDVWGVQINGINYALATLDGGLSIINTNDPSNPVEVRHINRTGYSPFDPSFSIRLNVPDVETFTYNGITYAYLATNDYTDQGDKPLVIILNLNAAINLPVLPIEYLFDPESDPPDPNSVFAGKIDDILPNIYESHTLTIEDGYLYVATLNQYIPIWYLGNNPTNPLYVTSLFNNTPNAALHEIYAVSHITNRVNLYLSFLRGGLRTYYIIYIPGEGESVSASVSSSTIHIYDFDRAYPDLFDSNDPLFDFRFTHSTVPSENGAYVFTTDELAVNLDDTTKKYVGNGLSPDPNLYYTSQPILRSPRREGAFLRVWQTILLGQSSSYKGGYYVSEESPWGITDLSQIDTSMVPNSIHQMVIRNNYMYVAHYTQGFRLLDISDPENIIELGWYDDHLPINFNPNSDYFFRKFKGRWHNGIYGVFPDPNRSNICYAGGYPGGFYIFDVTPPPYPPMNFTITKSSQDHPYLQWSFTGDENNIDHYNIYKKTNSIGYQLFDQTQNKYYEDITETIYYGGGQGHHWVYYYITAVSISDYESNASDRKGVDVEGIQNEEKIVASGEPKMQFEYSLSSNYPNPFNPSTSIDYAIKSAGVVTLKVYDMLGKEVANLVNERKEPGSYSVTFNAENLPSGIYVYKITANYFTSTKKLMLLK